MPTILELFKKSPVVYTRAQNLINFEQAAGTPNPKKLETKSLVKVFQTKPELYSNAENLINFSKVDGASIKKMETPNLIKIFKSSPAVYSNAQNLINFQKVDETPTPKKLQTKSLVSIFQGKPELYSNAKNLINFDKIDGASIKKLQTQSLVKVFQTKPELYSNSQNLINFQKVDGMLSLKKIDQTPLSDNNTKNIDKRGIYYNPIIYTSGINYSLLDFTKKNAEISIFNNNSNRGKKLNNGFNKILGSSVFNQVRNNIEQDFSGIRITSGVEQNNVQLYGIDALRFKTRSTTMMNIMRDDRGVLGQGLTSSLVKTLDKGLTRIKGFLGYPQPANPSSVIQIGRRSGFRAFSPKDYDPNTPLSPNPFKAILQSRWKGNEQKTMLIINRIKDKTGGTEIGKLIKDSLGGTPKTVGNQFLGNGIQLVKDNVRSSLYNPGTLRENNIPSSEFGAYGSYYKSYSAIKKEKFTATGEDIEQDLLNQLDLIKRYSPVNGIERKEKPRLIGNAFTRRSTYSDKDQFGYTEYAFKKKNSEHDGNYWPKYSPYTRNDGKGSIPEPNNYTNKALVSGSVTPTNPRGTKLSEKSLTNYRGIDYIGSNGQLVHGDIISRVTPTYINKILSGRPSGSNDSFFEDNGEFIVRGQKYKDLVPMWINRIGAKNPVVFRTNISGLTENVTPTWSSNKFLGNPFNFYNYSGVERSVSFNLQVYAFSKDELQFNWEKICELTLMAYPTILENKLVNPPIIEFRLGDIYKKKKGFIESLSYTMPDTGLWETETDGSILPKFIDVSLTIKFIETESVVTQKKPYSYNFTART